MTTSAEAKLQAIRDGQKKASKKQREKRKALGYKLLGVEFSPEGLAALAVVKAEHGSMSAAVNAALIEAARKLGDPDNDRELPPLTNAELKAIVAAMPVGRPAEAVSKPKAARNALVEAHQATQAAREAREAAKTRDKAEKAVSETPARTVAVSKLDLQVGPQPFRSRLKAKK